jgi:hypothetical protein
LKWEVMEHGFHLFGPLTEAIGGKRFWCDEDVKTWCISGYVRNQRLSIMMTLRSW